MLSKSEYDSIFENKNELLTKKFKYLSFFPFENPSELFKEHCRKTFIWIHYLKYYLQDVSDEFLQTHQIYLPERGSNKKTLFLDLDETLIHSCSSDESAQYEIDSNLKINVRPFCRDFLENMSQFYEIFIFTSSKMSYAQKIIDILDPYCDYIEGILDRRKCYKTKNKVTLKDLKCIKNRKIEDMVIVDNCAFSFGSSIDNGIPILPFYNDSNDKELIYLSDYLEEAAKSPDIREFNKLKLALQNTVEFFVNK